MVLYDQARRGIDAGRNAEDVIASYETPDRHSEYIAASGSVRTIVQYIYAGR